jgi:CRP-like cAMP-binding protein
MRRRAAIPRRLLPDGTPLQNRLLAALPTLDYRRIARHLRVQSTVIDGTLHEDGRRIDDVYFPNGGVFSITSRLQDGSLVEVATVGREGMLGVGVFLGDRTGTGRTFQQVGEGQVVALAVSHFRRETAVAGAFRNLVALYTQATLLQTMQCTACNARHDVTQRCCRWILETHDRVDSDDFAMKHQFLALMLGVQRPTVTVVLRGLQELGLIAGNYGRMRVLKRRQLEAASCECYGVICGHFARLGLWTPSGPHV